MSKNQKPEQTPTEEAQGATAEHKAAEIAAEEQAAAEKAKLDAEAAEEQAAKEAEQSKKAAEEQALQEAANAAETKHTVIMRFFSKDKIQYEIGDDVSHLDAERLDSLVNRGLVSKS